MTSARRAEEAMTADVFLAWSEARGDGRRFELLDGLPVAMSSEQVAHARVKLAIVQQLAAEIARRKLPCEAFADGMAVLVDGGNVFEPDALVRCGARLADDAVIIEDPVIVVEVASPSTQRVDALVKLSRYFANPHIVHYLIAIPTTRTILHHRRGRTDELVTSSHEDGSIQLDPPGLSIDVSGVFQPP